MRRRKMFWAAVLIAAVIAAGCSGCNQPNKVPVTQESVQQPVTPTTTTQDSATQGSTVNVYVINAPGRTNSPNPAAFNLGGDGIKSLVDEATKTDGTATDNINAGYAQKDINININTGSTTPTQTGSTTATASATQTPTQSPTVSPVQDVKPEFTSSVPIGVAWAGGQVDQQATAAGKGTVSDTAKTSSQESRWAQLKAAADALGITPENIAGLLQSVFGGVATSQPE